MGGGGAAEVEKRKIRRFWQGVSNRANSETLADLQQKSSTLQDCGLATFAGLWPLFTFEFVPNLKSAGSEALGPRNL